MKQTIQKGLQKLENRYNQMEKAAKVALRLGLLVVVLGSLILLSLVLRADSAALVRRLYESVGAIAACVPIVFGGAVALDWVLKER